MTMERTGLCWRLVECLGTLAVGGLARAKDGTAADRPGALSALALRESDDDDGH
jgi:hypothetical protein